MKMNQPKTLMQILDILGIGSCSASTWNLQEDGTILTITIQGQRTASVMAAVPAPGSAWYQQKRKYKSPSTQRRDQKRYETFLNTKGVLNRNHEHIEEHNQHHAAPTKSVDNFSQTDLQISDKSSNTDFVDAISKSIQTDPILMRDKETSHTIPGDCNHINPAVADTKLNPTKALKIVEDSVISYPMETNLNNVQVQKRVTDRITKIQHRKGRFQCLVKWKDLPQNKNTWVTLDKLDATALDILNIDGVQQAGPWCTSVSGPRTLETDNSLCYSITWKHSFQPIRVSAYDLAYYIVLTDSGRKTDLNPFTRNVPAWWYRK